jgi:N-acetyl-alpha-D-muramate 1-phosphate uridylyltransferase
MLQAMILAAGLGTRLKPITDIKPKALVEVGGFTMLELSIRYLKKYGIKKLIINVHHFPDQIKDFLEEKNNFGLEILFSDESDALLDTGGAIKKARPLFDPQSPFILMAVDILTDLDLGAMIEFHEKHKPLVTLAVKDRSTSRSLLFNSSMQLKGWRNNRTGQLKGVDSDQGLIPLGFSVIHIIEPSIFNLIEEEGAFSIIDLYLRLMVRSKILGFRQDSSAWLEFGRIETIRELERGSDFKNLIGKL